MEGAGAIELLVAATAVAASAAPPLLAWAVAGRGQARGRLGARHGHARGPQLRDMDTRNL